MTVFADREVALMIVVAEVVAEVPDYSLGANVAHPGCVSTFNIELVAEWAMLIRDVLRKTAFAAKRFFTRRADRPA